MLFNNTNPANDDSAKSLPNKFTDVRARTITALILGPLTLAFLLAGSPFTLFLSAVTTTAVFYEWIKLTSYRLKWRLGGLLYIGIAMMGLTFIMTRNSHFFLTLLIIVWATDIGAYFAGRLIGGPKLAPVISPGKTWSGTLGGSLIGIVTGVAIFKFSSSIPPFFPSSILSLPLLLLITLSAVIVVLAQLGDLIESWAKRRLNVKNSGTLLPGHGGVLDRIDSLLLIGIMTMLGMAFLVLL